MPTRIPVHLALAAILAGALSACGWLYKDDPSYCPGRPRDNCLNGEPGACASDEDCSGGTAVCDVTGTLTCVQCTPGRSEACTGTTPACGDDRMCRGCLTHAECPGSNACLPDGSCAEPGSVAYVESAALGGTDNASCTLAMPCTKVASALATGRSYVKLAGTIDEGVTIDNSRVVTILAEPGAKLTRMTVGTVLRVDGGSQVAIYDLEISGALGTNAGISSAATLSLTRAKVLNNAGGGISVSGGALVVTQSRIAGNTGGGILVVNGTFAVVGNVFFGNGSISSLVGGLSITAPQSAANRLEFNSFNKNATADGFAPAIQCTVGGGAFVARNNIMSDNGTFSNPEQTGGNCSHTYSIARPGSSLPGPGNLDTDPLFVNAAMGDLHLRPGSPALGAADPGADLTGPAARDIDGQPRTRPADMGADELP